MQTAAQCLGMLSRGIVYLFFAFCQRTFILFAHNVLCGFEPHSVFTHVVSSYIYLLIYLLIYYLFYLFVCLFHPVLICLDMGLPHKSSMTSPVTQEVKKESAKTQHVPLKIGYSSLVC